MEILIGGIIASVALVGGVIVWAVRLEGRVNGNDTAIERLEERFGKQEEAIGKVDEKVENLTDYLLRKNGDK